MRFIQAKHFTPVANREIDLLVVHTMEFPEKPTAAEDVANFFHGSNAPQASAHYCLDNNSVVQCVRDHDVAWAAPYINHNGLHFEFSGYAAQSEKNWHDDYSSALLEHAAHLFARKALRYHIPAELVHPKDLKAGRSGITCHKWATKAFGPEGGHTDPGDNFPIDEFVSRVRVIKRHLRNDR
jgi:N-acetyl-anhydromuramyl-L-alanine amidase AmpD